MHRGGADRDKRGVLGLVIEVSRRFRVLRRLGRVPGEGAAQALLAGYDLAVAELAPDARGLRDEVVIPHIGPRVTQMRRQLIGRTDDELPAPRRLLRDESRPLAPRQS